MNFHPRRATGARAVTPQTLVQLTFDQCGGDRQAAATAVRRAAQTNAALHEHLLEVGARTVVGNLICSDRAKIFTGNPAADVTSPRLVMAHQHDTGHSRRVAGRAALEVRMLLSAPLSSGKRMGSATRADVMAEAALYEPQARDMWTKVNYFRLVATDMPDGKVVEQVFTNEQLTALLERARRIPA